MLKRTFAIALIACLGLAGCTAEKPASDTEAAAGPTGKVVSTELNPTAKPSLYVELPEWCPTPDGTTLHEETGLIFMNCPNFAEVDDDGKKVHPSVLVTIDKDGKVEKVLDYAPHAGSGQTGPMGLDFGPDGHLYVADNQYFHGDDPATEDVTEHQYPSGILRVEMADGKPTGKVDTVVVGTALSNALAWKGDYMYLTDTFLPGDTGGVWRFSLDEVSGDEPVTVAITEELDDPHLIAVFDKTVDKGRGDLAGADGCTFDSEGNLWVGNFGDGVVHKVSDTESDEPTVTKVIDDQDFQCCDGIFYDAGTGLIYLTDSMKNAVWTLDPKAEELALLWENGDTDGADGLLDQPCEPIVRDGKLILVMFDWCTPEWGLTNSGHDDKDTLSVIDLTKVEEQTDEAE